MFRSGLACVVLVVSLLLAPAARSDDAADRPAVGGVVSPQGAMIFYAAHGQDGACGPHCAEWIAAEGIVEWDTFKRLLAFLAHPGQRKMPVVLSLSGKGDIKVATTLGRIIRDHGLDVSVGKTVVAECADIAEVACLALKRSGKPLEAKIDSSSVECDVGCVMILAGGVQRTLPADAKVAIGPIRIQSRLAPNVSDERQKGLQTYFDDQFRLYLTQMGVSTEVVEMIERNSASGHATAIARADWQRLGIVTGPSP